VFFLTVPVLVWMLIRGSGRRRSLELAVAMLMPMATIVLFGQLTRATYLLWLVTAIYPAMSLGMIAYLLFRRGVFDRGRSARHVALHVVIRRKNGSNLDREVG
jgi:hypothetical protein